jgi:transposase
VERRIPPDHPLRATRKLTDAALAGLSRDFDKLYARDGRPSIPPSDCCGRCCCRAFYTVRSERQLMEQLDYNLLFAKFFAGVAEPAAGQSRGPGQISARRVIKRHFPPWRKQMDTEMWKATLQNCCSFLGGSGARIHHGER